MVHVLNSLPTNATKVIHTFHQNVAVRARRVGAGIASLHMLQQQLQVYEDIMKDLATTTRDKIAAQQREVNREFTPVSPIKVLPFSLSSINDFRSLHLACRVHMINVSRNMVVSSGLPPLTWLS